MHAQPLLHRLACAALTLIASVAQAADLAPEEHLRQVKEALVQAALQRPVAVTATQWLDTSGQLRESSEFRSGMVVRGVRLLPQEDNATLASDAPTSRVAWMQSRDLMETPCDRKPLNGNAPKHTVRWQLRWEGAMSAQTRWDLSRLQVAMDQVLWPQLQAMDGMILVQAPPVRNSYERSLAGNSRNELQMVLNLVLSAGDPNESPSRSYLLNWQLVDQTTNKIWWSQQQRVSLPEREPQVSPPALEQDVRAQLIKSIQQASQALEGSLRCQSPRYELTRTPDRLWRIQAGSLNGLRVGDRLLLLPSHHRMGDEWDPKNLQQVALVQVKSLNENDAQVVPFAGPPPTPNGRWVAMPSLP